MKRSIPIVIALMLTAGAAFAGATPQLFYKIEIQARELANEGLQKRLACMRAACPVARQFAIDETFRQKVLELHARYATTPSKLSGWYAQHIDEAKAYLLANPRVRQRLDDLAVAHEELSDKITPLLETQAQ